MKRQIVITPYQERWKTEFIEIGKKLRSIVGDGNGVLRIDHIGSTAVPNLGAKDIIDVQITVNKLENTTFQERLERENYVIKRDYLDNFVGLPDDSPELKKFFMRELEGQRRMHMHIREMGRFNQRFPLLFRDYLQASAPTRLAYHKVKVRLAELFPESIDGYLSIKDPLMDLIYEAATHWGAHTQWQMDEDYL